MQSTEFMEKLTELFQTGTIADKSLKTADGYHFISIQEAFEVYQNNNEADLFFVEVWGYCGIKFDIHTFKDITVEEIFSTKGHKMVLLYKK